MHIQAPNICDTCRYGGILYFGMHNSTNQTYISTTQIHYYLAQLQNKLWTEFKIEETLSLLISVSNFWISIKRSLKDISLFAQYLDDPWQVLQMKPTPVDRSRVDRHIRSHPGRAKMNEQAATVEESEHMASMHGTILHVTAREFAQ